MAVARPRPSNRRCRSPFDITTRPPAKAMGGDSDLCSLIRRLGSSGSGFKLGQVLRRALALRVLGDQRRQAEAGDQADVFEEGVGRGETRLAAQAPKVV